MNTLNALTLFAQQNKDADGMMAAIMAGLVTYLVVVLVIFVVTAIGKWKAFEKAGQPGWAAIIPIYDFYIMNQIAKKEPMWFYLYLLGVLCFPLSIIALVAMVVVNLEFAKKFGQGGGYGIGLTFLPFIFFPMLGFGAAQYQGSRKKSRNSDDDENW